MTRRPALLATLLAALLAPAAALAGDPPEALSAGSDGPRVLAICVDGLQARAFERALAEGKLPAISRLLARESSVVGRALSSFPSSTAPSIPELLTGRYADRTPGMPRAIHAFDRLTSSARRYSLEPESWEDGTPTLFTLLDSRGETSFSLFEGKFSGSESFSSKRELVWGGVLEKLRLRVYNPDRSLLKRFRRMVEVRGAPPRAALLVMNSVDLAGHLRSPESARYLDSLEDLDKLLGEELFDWMEHTPLPEGGNYLDGTIVAIFGDHGMEAGGRFSDVAEPLKKMGLKVRDLGTVVQVAFRERFSARWAERPDVVLAPGGSNVSQIYLRRPDGEWGDGPAGPEATEEVAAAVAGTPGVEFVIRRLSEDTLELRGHGARRAYLVSRGEDRDREFAYLVEPGDGPDPLGYLADPRARALVAEAPAVSGHPGPAPAEAFRTFSEWHDATAETGYPAAVPLVIKGSAPGPLQGDLVITSDAGWSFLRHTQGDHGGLRKDSIETALVLAGPGVLPGASLRQARLIDLMPTFLEAMSIHADVSYLAGLDGRTLPAVAAGVHLHPASPAPPVIEAHSRERERERAAKPGRKY